tara:strand:+ start:552 stop:2942 length:2391 start_codon:yes stop_codon:yes gene_type:complete
MTCENQISTEDLINAKSDAVTLGEVATSREGAEVSGVPITQSTNRFGETTDTLQGRLNKLGVIYDDPIRDWSASLLVDDLRAHRYPATTGDIYIPVKPLPFTTGATFNTGDWVLLNGYSDDQIINILNENTFYYVFDTVADMQSGDAIGGVSVTFADGMAAKVNGENDTFTNYKVSTVGGIDLGGGLWAKELKGSLIAADGVETVLQARSITGLIDTNTVSINNPAEEFQKGQYYADLNDTSSSDDNGKTCIVTDEGVRLKVGIRPITSDYSSGTNINNFDDNGIFDSIYGAFIKVGTTLTTTGSIPQLVTGTGSADTAMGSTVDYTSDFIYYLSATANAAGVSTVRLGDTSEALSDLIEISFNYNHVTSLPEVGTVSINIFNLFTRVLYTGTQTVDLAITYDSVYKTFHFLNRGAFSFYTEIADRVNFSSITRSFEALAYANEASGVLTITHSKVCHPNYIAIGDSLCAGINFYSPNPAQLLTDYNHQWEVHSNAEGINTVIMNRGVGGNRSDAINARVAHLVAQQPRQAYLHLSTNDANGTPMTYATRSLNTQNSIDEMVAGGVQVILLNSVYPNNNPTRAAYYQDYLTDDDGFKTLSNYKTFVNQMLVLADGSGTLDPAYTDPDGVHLNQAGYTLFGQTVADATFSPSETVNKINDDFKFDFPAGLQSKGLDVNTTPTGWAIIEPIAGTLDYNVTTTTAGAENVVLGAYRQSPNAWLIHVIFSEQVEPALLSTSGQFSGGSDAGLATFFNTTSTGNGARDATYFCNLIYNSGVAGSSIPTEAEMQTLAWFVRF